MIGQVVQVDGEPTTIVGVLPASFSFPSNTSSAWFPLTLDRAQREPGHVTF